MTKLTVTGTGQATFRKEALQPLGIRPGEMVKLDVLTDGRDMLKAARPGETINGFIGLLAGKTKKVITIDEINDAAAQGWRGKGLSASVLRL